MDSALKFFLAIFLLLTLQLVAFANIPSNPCADRTNLFAVVDRPTVGDSACVVANKNSIIELGYQYQNLQGGGYQYNAPQLEYRLGLINNYEAVFILPNYIHQTLTSGFSTTTLGIKHQALAQKNWVLSFEGLLTPPSGSSAFGSNNLGATFNGIFSYNFTDALNLTAMGGISSQNESTFSGGQRYFSVNPDLVLSWNKDKISIYGELYGQSRTEFKEGSGFNADTGILYLLKKNISIDLEIGQHLSGSLGGYNHYIGTGMAILLN